VADCLVVRIREKLCYTFAPFFYMVKAILLEVVDSERIVMRDVQRCCSVLLYDNNRKPVCRFRFNSLQKSLGLFDNEEKKETAVPINGLDDIYKYADRLKATVSLYGKPNGQ
jgi:hypothetical protein